MNRLITAACKVRHIILTVILTVSCILSASAQEIQVMVTSLYNPMPPQGMMYINNPGKYFNITLKNLTDQTQNVILGFEVKQLFPDQGLSVTTPSTYKPIRGIVVPPSGQVSVTQAQLREMCRYIPLNQVTITGADVLENYDGGNLGLLPEGSYQVHVTAYRLDYAAQYPEVLSNPLQGSCNFDICYNAQAPTFLAPRYMKPLSDAEPESQNDLYRMYGQDDESLEAVAMEFDNAVFSWTAPVMNSARTPVNYNYTLELYRMQPGRNAEDAISDGIRTLQIKNINTTQYRLSQTVLRQLLSLNSYFVARVQAVPENNDKENEKYTTVENDGYSPLQVVRFNEQKKIQEVVIDQPKKEDYEDDDEDEDEDEDVVVEDVKVVNWLCTNPKITSPVVDKGVTSSMIEADQNIEVEWTKSKAKSMPGDKDTLKYKYDVKLFKMTAGQTVKTCQNNSPLYKQTDIEGTKATIKWDDIKKSIKYNDYLVLAVIPKAVNDKGVEFEDNTDNTVQLNYVKLVESNWTPCYPDNADTIKDKTLAVFHEKELADMVVNVCGFPMTIENASLISKKYYQGRGYITWKPGDFAIKIAVEFDSIWINKNKTVYNGVIRNRKDDTRDFIPYDLFSGSSSSTVQKMGDGLKEVVNYASKIEDQDFQKYYKLTQQGVMLVDGLFKQDIGPLTLPMSITNSIAPESDFDVQILGCEFSATTAAISMVGMFTLPESDYTNNRILVFGAPKICVQQNSFLPTGAVLSLLTDLSLRDPQTGYEWRFTAPSNLDDPEDGCAIVIADNTLKQVNLEVEMSLNGLLKDDGKGGVIKDAPAQGRFRVEVGGGKWTDWLAEVEIDPFQVEEAPGYTFSAGGVVSYDHSSHTNPTGLTVPQGYRTELFKYTDVEEGNEVEKTLTGTEGKPMPKQWQGFYMSNLSVKMPCVIKCTDGEAQVQDVNSADYQKGNRDERVGFGVEELLVDRTGVSFEANVSNLINAEMGGWKATIEKIYVQLVQNKFGSCGFNGKIAVPIMEGDLNYKASLSYYDKTPVKEEQDEQPDGPQEPEKNRHLKMALKVEQTDNLKLPCFLGDINFDKKSHFNLEYFGKNDSVAVELTLTGEYTIRTSGENEAKPTVNATSEHKTALALDLPTMRFVGLRIANFPEEEMKKPEKPDYSGMSAEKKEKEQAQYEKYLADYEEFQGKEAVYKYENPESGIYFSLGHWRTASPQKKIGGFSFSLDKFEFQQDKKNDVDRLGLKLKGTIGLMDDKISASAGLTIWTKGLSLSMESLKNLDKLEYDETIFDEAAVNGDLGGCKFEGHLKVLRDGDFTGYDAALKLSLPGGLLEDENGLGIDLAGHFVEKLKTEDQIKTDVTKLEEKIRKGRFNDRGMGALYWVDSTYYSVSLKVVLSVVIPCGPVNITKIGGGFYINSDIQGNPMYGMYGGVLDVGLASPDGKMIVADPLELSCFYDDYEEKLSSIRLIGHVKAIEGIVDADAAIVYVNEKEDERYFSIDITADAKVDGKDAYEKILGKELKLPEIPSTGLEQLAADNEENKNTEPSEQPVEIKAGAHVAIQLKISLEPDNWKKNHKEKFQNKWHLYCGYPTADGENYSKDTRCNVTLIDYMVGKKGSDFCTWGTLYADAYLCLGNELPNDGAMPGIPDKVKQFLDGTDVNGKSQKLSDDVEAQKKKTQVEFTKYTQGGTQGGMMLGASLGGDFGFRAGICYADVSALMGFDLILKQLAEGAKCNGHEAGGLGGFYGMGQVYAMVQGEMGLILNLLVYKGDWPLISVGLGALLQGGFPNPSWVYGKVRAHVCMLGGLIDFNATAELKAGEVCLPEYANPLADIKIFGDVSPGSDTKTDGWDEDSKISCYSNVAFTTNMVMNKDIRIIDQNRINQEVARAQQYDMDTEEALKRYRAQAERCYRFRLEPTFELAYMSDKQNNENAMQTRMIGYETKNDKNFYVKAGARLLPDTKYRLTLKGYAKEVIGQNKEVDPILDDKKSHPWTDEAVYYFRTQSLPDKLDEDVAFTLPANNMNIKAFRKEASQPEIHLLGNRAEQIAQGDIYGRMEVQEALGNESVVWIDPAVSWNMSYVYSDGAFCTTDGKGHLTKVKNQEQFSSGLTALVKNAKSEYNNQPGSNQSTEDGKFKVTYQKGSNLPIVYSQSGTALYGKMALSQAYEGKCYWITPSSKIDLQYIKPGRLYRWTVYKVNNANAQAELEKQMSKVKTENAIRESIEKKSNDVYSGGSGELETDDTYNFKSMMANMLEEADEAAGSGMEIRMDSTVFKDRITAQKSSEEILYQIYFTVGEYDSFSDYLIAQTKNLKNDKDDNISGKSIDLVNNGGTPAVAVFTGTGFKTKAFQYSNYSVMSDISYQSSVLKADPYGLLAYMTDFIFPGNVKWNKNNICSSNSSFAGLEIEFPEYSKGMRSIGQHYSGGLGVYSSSDFGIKNHSNGMVPGSTGKLSYQDAAVYGIELKTTYLDKNGKPSTNLTVAESYKDYINLLTDDANFIRDMIYEIGRHINSEVVKNVNSEGIAGLKKLMDKWNNNYIGSDVKLPSYMKHTGYKWSLPKAQLALSYGLGYYKFTEKKSGNQYVYTYDNAQNFDLFSGLIVQEQKRTITSTDKCNKWYSDIKNEIAELVRNNDYLDESIFTQNLFTHPRRAYMISTHINDYLSDMKGWATDWAPDFWKNDVRTPTTLNNIESVQMEFIRFNCLDTEDSSGMGLSGYGVRRQSVQKPQSDYVFDYSVKYPFGK